MNLTQITLPKGLTKIGLQAFNYCTNLTQITLPEGLVVIQLGAFSGCTNLTQINLPEGITEIGKAAFSGCTNLTEITLPKGIMEIVDWTFHGCTSLKQINLPEGITKIGSNAFEDCKQVQQIIIWGNDIEAQKIKSLLPQELQNKVVSKEFVLRWQLNVKEVLTQNGIIDDLIKPIFKQGFFKLRDTDKNQLGSQPTCDERPARVS